MVGDGLVLVQNCVMWWTLALVLNLHVLLSNI
jgi:hypothetical protein